MSKVRADIILDDNIVSLQLSDLEAAEKIYSDHIPI